MSIYQGSLLLTPSQDNSNYYITETNNNQQLRLWVGTRKEYNELEDVESDIIYITTDGDPDSNIENDYMLKSLYDKENLRMDIYEYIDLQMKAYNALYDIVLQVTNGNPELKKGDFDLVKAKVVNNEPVLALCIEAQSISGYSLQRSSQMTVYSSIASEIRIDTSYEDMNGNYCEGENIRIEINNGTDYRLFPGNIVQRVWVFGENG